MNQVRIADLPSSPNVDQYSYMIVERPGVGDGTYKTTLGKIQEAITVRANVTQADKLTKIVVKDITGEYVAYILTPTAKITDNGDNTCTIKFVDTDGITEETVVSRVELDEAPTEGSPNLLTSGTIYDILYDPDYAAGRISQLEREFAQLMTDYQALQREFVALAQDTEERLIATESTVSRSLTVEWGQEIEDPYSIGGGQRFSSLLDAIMAGSAQNKTITLFGCATAEGITVPEGTDFTLDLNGYRLTMKGPGAGSEDEASGMHFVKGSNITIKNGKILFDSSEIGTTELLTEDDEMLILENGEELLAEVRISNCDLKTGIKNFSNLTLDNVDIEGGPTIEYVVSTRFGNTTFKNKTAITSWFDKFTFDAIYGTEEDYDEGVNVYIDDFSVKVNGKAQFGKADRVTHYEFKQHAGITTPVGYYLDVDLLTIPCEWLDNGDGTKTLKYSGL